MTVEELRTKKAALQFELRNIIGDKIIVFEKETGVAVSDIHIHVTLTWGLEVDTSYIESVECDLNL